MHTHFFNVEVYILYSQKCLQDMKFCGLRFWQESTNIVSTKTFGTCHSREVSTMSLLRYFSQTSSLPSSGSVPSLTSEALHKANTRVTSLSREPDEGGPGPKHTKNTYPSYSTEDSARIGRHAVEHGPNKASRHFTAPESIVRLLKKKYLAELHDRCQNSVEVPQVTSFPTKVRGRPLFLGSTLDCQVKSMLLHYELQQEWSTLP